jgi:UDP-GlcNAc:undecaprenyl-phosphate/decaprenyl-phosphate GlcNAc-1-phosphate transferase
MYVYYFSFVVAAMAISYVITPLVSRLACKNGVLDHPGGRKQHHVAKPLLGGLSFFLATIITISIFYPMTNRILSLFFGAILIVVVGLIDDIKGLRPLQKLCGQLVATTALVLFNLDSFSTILNFMNLFFIPDFITVILIIGWVVLLINAFNLIDGLDGLAAGTAVVITAALAAVTIIQGNFWLMGILLIGLGALLGFLPYNVYKAKIFMGDAGSMLLGYTLAAAHLFAITQPFSLALVLGSAFIFAYPALDVVFAVYRRLRYRGNIFTGDRGHIHHLLLDMGLPMYRVVLILCLANLFFAGLGVLLLCTQVGYSVVLFMGIFSIAGAVWLFRSLTRFSRRRKLDEYVQG